MNLVANTSTDKIAYRNANAFTDEVKTRYLDSSKCAACLIHRILSRHKVGLRPVLPIAFVTHLGIEHTGYSERINADDLIFDRPERGCRGFASISFIDTDDTIFTFKFYDRAERIRSVKSIRAS